MEQPSAAFALVGVPTDRNSSFLRGAAAAPAFIRAALLSPGGNLTTESGATLDVPGRLVDRGDLPLAEADGDFETIEAAIAGERLPFVALGGDHSITYPILRGLARAGVRPSILHFDAHPDLYDTFEGNRFSHASPFARIMEEGLAAALVQVGIRTANAHQREQAARFGVRMVEMAGFAVEAVLVPDGPVYVSIDLDGLDPAFAPGVSHPEPGGLTVREVLGVLRNLPGPVIGADVVELNPSRDPLGLTAAVAAKLVKELAARMV